MMSRNGGIYETDIQIYFKIVKHNGNRNEI